MAHDIVYFGSDDSWSIFFDKSITTDKDDEENPPDNPPDLLMEDSDDDDEEDDGDKEWEKECLGSKHDIVYFGSNDSCSISFDKSSTTGKDDEGNLPDLVLMEDSDDDDEEDDGDKEGEKEGLGSTHDIVYFGGSEEATQANTLDKEESIF